MPIRRPREMNLGNRGGGYRALIKRREQGAERVAELGLDQGMRFAAREWRQTILQACKIEGDLLAKQIGSRREELAELDKARPQFFESGGEPLTRARPADAMPPRK